MAHQDGGNFQSAQLRMEPDSDNRLGLMVEDVIKPRFHHVFPFPCFNKMQSKVLDCALNSDVSVAVSAPTGTGKTVVLELAIVRLLDHPFEQNDQNRIVYLAPTKALCAERTADWRNKYGQLGLKIIELTTDQDYDDKNNLLNYNIIITTPEKWDLITRQWRSGAQFNFIRSVKLVLVDEIHLINSGSRGATLEAVLSRMKAIKENFMKEASSLVPLRFVSISATCPNINDIAEWLSTENCPGEAYAFGEEVRPVPLECLVFGYPQREQSSDFGFDMNLTFKIPEIINNYSDGKPTLIFCSTRRGTESTAIKLSENMRCPCSSQDRDKRRQIASRASDPSLQKSIAFGIAFHHAGLSTSDRKLVEENFIDGAIFVLVSTSTLAMGVNLPAHLVIIKGTSQYLGGKYQDYNSTDVIQMLGRAGRPQYDTKAVAVIMTKAELRDKYERLLGGSLPVESSLHLHLVEQLNAEIVLGAITDVATAFSWLKSTYFFKRVVKNSVYYGAPPHIKEEQLLEMTQKWITKEIKKLSSGNLISITPSHGNSENPHQIDLETCDDRELELCSVSATQMGKLMSKWYLSVSTMTAFSSMTGNEDLCILLADFCALKEISGDLQVRQGEKKALNDLNSSPCIRYKFNGKISERGIKAMVLIQAILGQATFMDNNLAQEAQKIVRTSQRVSRALVEFTMMGKQRGFELLVSAVTLYKSLMTHLWPDSVYVSRQLKKIGPAMSQHLADANFHTFAQIADADPAILASTCNRGIQFGLDLRESARRIPQFDIRMKQTYSEANRNSYRVTVACSNVEDIQRHEPWHNLVLVIGSEETNAVFMVKRIRAKDFTNTSASMTVNFRAPEGPVTVALISEKYAGIDLRESYYAEAVQEEEEEAYEEIRERNAICPSVINVEAEVGPILGKGKKVKAASKSSRATKATTGKKKTGKQSKLTFRTASELSPRSMRNNSVADSYCYSTSGVFEDSEFSQDYSSVGGGDGYVVHDDHGPENKRMRVEPDSTSNYSTDYFRSSSSSFSFQ